VNTSTQSAAAFLRGAAATFVCIVACFVWMGTAERGARADDDADRQTEPAEKTDDADNQESKDRADGADRPKAQPDAADKPDKPNKQEPKAGEAQAAGKNEAEARDAAPQAAPKNPLGQLIRNLLPKQQPNPGIDLIPKPQAEGADGDESPEGDQAARDRIDALAPFDSKRTAWLRRAAGQMEQGNWSTALEMLQRLLDDPDDSVIRRHDGQWVSAREEANRMLGAFPADFLQNTYRRHFDGLARQELDEARRLGDVDRVAAVATRLFHTRAGYEAANHLGSMHFDRGEFSMAALWFQRLLEAGAGEITSAPKWRFKAALAFREAGRSAGGADLLQALASTGDSPKLEIGGERISAERWLESVAPWTLSPAPQLSDWPMYFGTPSRTATVVGGDPLLLERWSHPNTNMDMLQTRIGDLVQDLTDLGRATIPAAFPLAVDGKIAFSTLTGIQVVDATTGRALWETREGAATEHLATSSDNAAFPVGRQVVVRQVGFAGRVMSGSGAGGEHDLLASRLFRDAVSGFLSSDGRHLFVIEDQAVTPNQPRGYRFGVRRRGDGSDALDRDLSSNKLTAYDLDSGRPRWEVGGIARDEPFDLPLAGTYFFGPPAPEGDQLFAIGEKDNEIRLHAVEARTGKPLWSQLIAFSDAKIEKDVGRRWWAAQVAIGEGVLVCPTTTGWLVGVDRINRSVLWAYRYSKPTTQTRGRRGEQQSLVSAAALNTRWAPSAPVIVGHQVVYTPSEHSTVVCLNLIDGSLAWEKSKGDFLYLAGVHDGRVVLVGKTEIAALSLADGRTVWSRPIPDGAGLPAGVGIAVADRYYLPLQSGRLMTLDLATGDVLGSSYLSAGSRPLGNLAMYQGMVLSLGPWGLTSFEQREAVETEIARRQERNPLDAWALLRQADIQILKRNYSEALAVLEQIPADRIDASLQPHYRQSMIESLEAAVRADFTDQKQLGHLEQFAQTSDERLNHRRLAAERLIALEDYPAAFEIYWQLAQEDGSRRIRRNHESPVAIRLDLWLGGQLADMWPLLSDEQRTELDERVAAALGESLGEDLSRQEHLAALFGFHPAAVSVKRNLVERAIEAGRLHQAENRMLDLSRHPDRSVRAAAVAGLGRLFDRHQLPHDAAHYFQQLLDQYEDVPIQPGQTGRNLVEAWRAAQAGRSWDAPYSSAWGEMDLKVVRGGSNYSHQLIQELQAEGSDLPFFRDYRLQVDPQQQRLTITKADDESLYWTVPLRSKSRTNQSSNVAVQVSGHQLFVLHRDVIHCLSPAERKVVWTRPLETRGNTPTYYRQPSRFNIAPMQRGETLASRSSLSQNTGADGMLAISNSRYVAYYGRRQFTLLDAATGEILWTYENLPTGALICGDEEVLYIIPQDRSRAVALRALDGKPLDIPNLGSLLGKTVQLAGRNLVTVETKRGTGLLGAKHAILTIRLYDPLAGRTVWEETYPAQSSMSLLDDRRLIVLNPDGGLELLDLISGAVQKLGRLSSEELQGQTELYAVGDFENIYLIANQQRRGGFFSESLPSVRVHGMIFAFHRRTGERIWHEKIEGQNLLLQQLEHSPILVFAVRQYQRKGNLGFTTSNIIALDKRTGRKLAEISSPSNSGGIRSVEVNRLERYVELRSYNERIRLSAVDREVSKVDTKDSEEDQPAPAPPVPADDAEAGRGG
jgi:outer membrane protein assembly factor BamB